MADTMQAIDFNSDLGESFGHWTLGDDAAMVRLITSANLACGMHAGDFTVMDQTVALCKAAGVGVGAQPGYPDLQGFGRRPIAFPPAEVEQCVLYQIGALYGFCRAHGVEITHVKAHGALYNQAADDPALARAIARGTARFSRAIPLVGLASSRAFAEAAADAGLPFVAEAFADRRYNPDGTLQSRAIAGSLITDPEAAATQVLRIVGEGTAVAHDGTTIPLRAQSVCFHGDTPGAPTILATTRARLETAGVAVRPLAALLAAPARRGS
jgi:5-oxoprolinase (ATP-hydrolysing) subunit A